MKKSLLSASLFLSLGLNAQIINIPDVNFKTLLLNSPSINTNNDLEIQVSEAYAYSGAIEVPSASITDLTGIEYFTNIHFLNVSSNQLTNLDLSTNSLLDSIDCSWNDIALLNISNLNNLIKLNCFDNNITNLSLGQNTNIKYLRVGQNDLTSIDLSQCSNIISLDIDNNSNITSLDISNLSNLQYLECWGINVNTVDVSNNTHLKALFISNFTSLDLSNNLELEMLGGCGNSHITSLDLSIFPNFSYLCWSNSVLESINLNNGNNTNVSFLDLKQNPNLVCIQVDDVSWSTSNWTYISDGSGQIDSNQVFSNTCYSEVRNLNQNNQINVYPNPTNDILYFKTDKIIKGIEIYTLTGQKLLTLTNHNIVDLSELVNGVYMAKITTADNQIINKRIIKE